MAPVGIDHSAFLPAHQLPARALVVPVGADRCAAHAAKQQHEENLMNILLAINDSPYSTTAVEEVRRRPWSPGTIVRVLSAIEPITPPAAKLWIAVGGSFDGMAQEMKRQHEELTARAADSL